MAVGVSNWGKKLPKPIALRDGRKITTLHELRAIIVKLPPMLKDDALEYGLELLLRAGETGRKADIAAADAQMRIVLSMRQMVKVD